MNSILELTTASRYAWAAYVIGRTLSSWRHNLWARVLESLSSGSHPKGKGTKFTNTSGVNALGNYSNRYHSSKPAAGIRSPGGERGAHRHRSNANPPGCQFVGPRSERSTIVRGYEQARVPVMVDEELIQPVVAVDEQP
jgi:hypothetical protein